LPHAKTKTLVVAILDVTAVLFAVRQLAITYYRPKAAAAAAEQQAPDSMLDQINIRYFAYKGMRTEDVHKLYPLPVEMIGALVQLYLLQNPVGRYDIPRAKNPRRRSYSGDWLRPLRLVEVAANQIETCR